MVGWRKIFGEVNWIIVLSQLNKEIKKDLSNQIFFWVCWEINVLSISEIFCKLFGKVCFFDFNWKFDYKSTQLENISEWLGIALTRSDWIPFRLKGNFFEVLIIFGKLVKTTLTEPPFLQQTMKYFFHKNSFQI